MEPIIKKKEDIRRLRQERREVSEGLRYSFNRTPEERHNLEVYGISLDEAVRIITRERF